MAKKTLAMALHPFVPSGPDFERSIGFFAELGFHSVWKDRGLAGLRFGEAYFIPQDINVPEWQQNQMLIIEVDDLALYWREIQPLDLVARYQGVRIKPPTDYPWGREIHIIDPGGVCWHVRQTRSAEPISSLNAVA